MSLDIQKAMDSYFRYDTRYLTHYLDELVPYYDEQLWEDVTPEIKEYIYKTFVGKNINYESPFTCYDSAFQELLKLDSWIYSKSHHEIQKDELKYLKEEIEEYFELNQPLILDEMNTISIFEQKEEIISNKIKLCVYFTRNSISHIFFYIYKGDL
jgi:hypothetical protein